MKIFVTGGAGFIGGNFVLKQVLNKNNEVLNYDKLTYAGNLDTLKNVVKHPCYQFVEGDICDRSLVKNAINQFKPDIIVTQHIEYNYLPALILVKKRLAPQLFYLDL